MKNIILTICLTLFGGMIGNALADDAYNAKIILKNPAFYGSWDPITSRGEEMGKMTIAPDGINFEKKGKMTCIATTSEDTMAVLACQDKKDGPFIYRRFLLEPASAAQPEIEWRLRADYLEGPNDTNPKTFDRYQRKK